MHCVTYSFLAFLWRKQANNEKHGVNSGNTQLLVWVHILFDAIVEERLQILIVKILISVSARRETCHDECRCVCSKLSDFDIPWHRRWLDWCGYTRNWIWFYRFYSSVTDTVTDPSIPTWKWTQSGTAGFLIVKGPGRNKSNALLHLSWINDIWAGLGCQGMLGQREKCIYSTII